MRGVEVDGCAPAMVEKKAGKERDKRVLDGRRRCNSMMRLEIHRFSEVKMSVS